MKSEEEIELRSESDFMENRTIDRSANNQKALPPLKSKPSKKEENKKKENC